MHTTQNHDLLGNEGPARASDPAPRAPGNILDMNRLKNMPKLL
jgi:hypothetical protein